MVRYAVSCLTLVVVSFSVTLAAETKDAPPAIVWEKGLDEAVAKAKVAHKNILLDFFAPT
ncbi:MAG: hypothetical protein F9K48_10575 [Candidatus Brocadia sp.]|nr:MAG: hypothetical protein F9K48_10575 [Candidatus Brocadia sp.]